MKFIKKPTVIEAFRYGLDKIPHWMYGKTWLANEHENSLTIHTLKGDMKAMQGDFIIKDAKGDIYPCKPNIFEATYTKFLES